MTKFQRDMLERVVRTMVQAALAVVAVHLADPNFTIDSLQAVGVSAVASNADIFRAEWQAILADNFNRFETAVAGDLEKNLKAFFLTHRNRGGVLDGGGPGEIHSEFSQLSLEGLGNPEGVLLWLGGGGGGGGGGDVVHNVALFFTSVQSNLVCFFRELPASVLAG